MIYCQVSALLSTPKCMLDAFVKNVEKKQLMEHEFRGMSCHIRHFAFKKYLIAKILNNFMKINLYLTHLNWAVNFILYKFRYWHEVLVFISNHFFYFPAHQRLEPATLSGIVAFILSLLCGALNLIRGFHAIESLLQVLCYFCSFRYCAYWFCSLHNWFELIWVLVQLTMHAQILYSLYLP